jgi:hypothetical protein
MTQSPLHLARLAEFQAYDVWNSTLQKARANVLQVRRKRNAAIHAYKAYPSSQQLLKKAIRAEQDLWNAETDYGALIFESKAAIEWSFASTLQGYHAPIGPKEMPVTDDEMTSFCNSE